MAITYTDVANIPSGVQPQTVLAAAYESRATQIARLFVPLAAFAGDTAQTLTDGSFNSNRLSVLPSSSAILAGPANIRGVDDNGSAPINPNNYNGNAFLDYAGQGNDVDEDNDGVVDNGDGGAINQVTAKPLVVRVRRDPFTGEVVNYGVFNADGSVPGQPTAPGTPLYTPGQAGDPFLPNGPDGAANSGDEPRYIVNRMTGEIVLNSGEGIVGVNLDSQDGGEIFRDASAQEALGNALADPFAHVVGIVEFKALEGAALSTAQQKASELSNVIQSLATLIRGFFDSERNILNTIR